MLDSVNFGFFVLSRCERFYCNAEKINQGTYGLAQNLAKRAHPTRVSDANIANCAWFVKNSISNSGVFSFCSYMSNVHILHFIQLYLQRKNDSNRKISIKQLFLACVWYEFFRELVMVILVMSFKLMLLNKISLCDDCDKVIPLKLFHTGERSDLSRKKYSTAWSRIDEGFKSFKPYQHSSFLIYWCSLICYSTVIY